MVSPEVTAALIAAVVTVILGAAATVFRYVFGVSLVTEDQLKDLIDDEVDSVDAETGQIMESLDRQGEQLNDIEELILGGEYQVTDGMLTLVQQNVEDIEDHGSRIDSVERIQLKIRRRQAEQADDDVDIEMIDAEDEMKGNDK